MDSYLRIADCLIRIQEPLNRHCIFWPDYPWNLFEFKSKEELNPDIDIEVRVVGKLPDLPHGRLLFDSNHGLWKLYEADADLYLESLHTKYLTPFRRAIISKDYTKAKVYALPTRYQNKRGWTPGQIVNPLGEICLLTWLARRGALMLHASGIINPIGALVFCGESGAGKTTIAEFYNGIAQARLSDETIIIRKDPSDGFTAYGTPWLGEGHVASNEKGSLRSLYMIRHGLDKHTISNLSILELTQRLFRQAFLPHWDREAMDKTALLFEDLSAQNVCFDLAFLKSPDVIEFLESQEPTLA